MNIQAAIVEVINSKGSEFVGGDYCDANGLVTANAIKIEINLFEQGICKDQKMIYTAIYEMVDAGILGKVITYSGDTFYVKDASLLKSDNTNERENADMITNKEYWNEVNATAETIVETAFDNLQYDGIESPTSEQVHDAIFDSVLHETIDCHQWVIYTAYHLPVLQHTDNAEYMVDNFGGDSVEHAVKESGITGLHQAMAFWALYADVMDKIDSDFIIDTLADKIEE